MSTKKQTHPLFNHNLWCTGDLSYCKLFPSIFHLYQQNNLDENIAIVAIGRRDITNDDFLINRIIHQRDVKDTNKIYATLWNMSSIIDMMLVMKKAIKNY